MFAKYNGSDLAFQIGTETAGATLRPLDFVTGGSRRMTIGTTGNVGIGTTAPSTLLEVALPASGNTQEQGIKLSRGSGFFSLGNATSLETFCGEFRGKGTLSSNALSLIFLGIAGSDSDVANPVMAFTSRNNANNAALGNSQLAFQFRNYTTNLVTVLGGGNVGIGTTAPSSKLEVVGAVTVSTYIKVSPVAVTSLPDATTAGVGARAFVNDALAPVFGSTVATGGAVAVPVYSDGSAWKVG
jgi:hypothetical protein